MNHSRDHGGYYRNTRGPRSNSRYQQRHHDHRYHDGHYFAPINVSGSQGNISQGNEARNKWAHGEGSSGNELSSDVGRHRYRPKSTELTKNSPCSSAVSQQCHPDTILIGDISVDLKHHHQDGPSIVDSSVSVDYASHITGPMLEKTSCQDAIGNSLRHIKGTAEAERSSNIGRHEHRQQSTDGTASPLQGTFSLENAVGDSLRHIKGTAEAEAERSSNIGRHEHRQQSTDGTASPLQGTFSLENAVGDSLRHIKGTAEAEAERSSNIGRHEHRQQSTDGTASPLQGTTSLENAVGDSLRHIIGSAETEGPSNIERHQHRQQSTNWTASSSPKSSEPLPIADSPNQKKELVLPSSSDTNKYQAYKIKRCRQGQTWSQILFGQESSEHPRSLPLFSSNFSHGRSSLPVHSGRKDILSNTGGRQKLAKSERTVGYSSKLSEISPTTMKFDICVTKRGAPVRPKPPKRFLLRPGMILLKNFISQPDQIKIVEVCRVLGLGDGGFYQPGFGDGRKMHLQMMCLGKNWDPITKLYEDRRPIDGGEPPSIPDDFKKLVELAIQSSRAFIKEEHKESKPEMILPWMQPDICIVNFYLESGRLGLHQDKDESKQSLRKGLPVVSFSIGDSADFIYADHRVEENPEEVRLDSGDVLIFGGDSRHIFHGVTSIVPNSAPSFLADEANLRPGRLNLTFRQY